MDKYKEIADLNKLIEDDKEYKSLTTEVYGYCDNAWDQISTREIAATPEISNLNIQELFAQFKCIRGWQVFIKRIFNLIKNSVISIPGTTKQITLEAAPGNGPLLFLEHATTKYITMSCDMLLRIKDLSSNKEEERILVLELTKPEYRVLGPAVRDIQVDLANSKMDMVLLESLLNDLPLHKETIKVKDFTENTLVNFISSSF